MKKEVVHSVVASVISGLLTAVAIIITINLYELITEGIWLKISVVAAYLSILFAGWTINLQEGRGPWSALWEIATWIGGALILSVIWPIALFIGGLVSAVVAGIRMKKQNKI